MDCEYYRELVSAQLDGQLGPDEQNELNHHLENCRACSDFVRDLTSLQATSTPLKDEVMPAKLEKRILRDTVGRGNPFRGYFVVPKPLVWVSAAAVVAMLAISNADRLGDGDRGQISPTVSHAEQRVHKVVFTEVDVVEVDSVEVGPF